MSWRRALFYIRSTSSRTVSLGRSTGATPRTGTLNSRDLHLSQMTNVSSGSHIISSSPPPVAHFGGQQTLASLTPTYNNSSNAFSYSSSVQLSPMSPPIDQSVRHGQLQSVNGEKWHSCFTELHRFQAWTKRQFRRSFFSWINEVEDGLKKELKNSCQKNLRGRSRGKLGENLASLKNPMEKNTIKTRNYCRVCAELWNSSSEVTCQKPLTRSLLQKNLTISLAIYRL